MTKNEIETMIQTFDNLSLEEKKNLTIQYLQDYAGSNVILRNLLRFLTSPTIIVNEYILKRIFYNILKNEQNVLKAMYEEEKAKNTKKTKKLLKN